MTGQQCSDVLLRRGWLAEQPAALQQAVLSRGKSTTYARGETVFRRGDPPGGIYGLAAGNVGYYLGEVQDSTYAFHIGHPGSWFGEPSMLRRKPRLVTAVARANTVLLHLPLDAFEAIVEQEPRHLRSFAALAADGAELTLQLLFDIWPASPQVRVARRVVGLLENDPPERVTDHRVVHVSQTELADMTGLSRPTVNIILQDFARAGVVDVGYRRLVLRDVAALRRIGADTLRDDDTLD